MDAIAKAEEIVAAVKRFVYRAIQAESAKQLSRIEALESRIAELEQQQSKGVRYRGAWTEHEQYDRSDMVTQAGCLWHCRELTRERPGTSAWQLMHKSIAR